MQALTTLKQKVRKYNKEFEAEIESFRENPINSEDEREGEAGETFSTLSHGASTPFPYFEGTTHTHTYIHTYIHTHCTYVHTYIHVHT